MVLLQLVCLCGGGMAYTTRHVNGDTGVDNSTCLGGSLPCATLAYALEDLQSDTSVLLDDQVLSHPNITTVQGNTTISNITISSSHGSTIINCSEEGGFAFINLDALTISNVEFHNCGALRDSTSYNADGDPLTYTVSLYLYNCTDVSLISTTVSDSPGAGVAMLAVTGRVEIIESTFARNGRLIGRNKLCNDSNSTLAGGALYIELPSCAPGMLLSECNGSDGNCPNASSLPGYSNVTYVIEKCSFTNNTAETPDYKTYSFIDYPNTNYFTAIGRGGGLSVFIKGTTENVRVVVNESSFDNNWALYGGGLFMELWHNLTNVSLEVLDSNFTRNELPYSSTKNIGTGGGGLRYAQPYCHGEGTTLLIKGCRFENNNAYWGGGASLSLQSERGGNKSDIIVENCTFRRNTARLGAAIDFNTYSGKPAALVRDLTVIDNSDHYADADNGGHIKGEGVVYTYLVTVYVNSSLTFLHNRGGAISSLYGTIHFLNDSISLFYDNHAFRGAALALFGTSAIVLYNGSKLNFTENKADTVGGAIYHAALGNRALLDSGACPIRMAAGLNWSHTDLWFINNSAAQGARGMSIYTYSIYPCVEESLTNLNETFKTFHYECDNVTDPNCMDLQLSGDGSIIKLTKNASLSLIAFPGEQVPLPFTVEDELQTKVLVHFEGVVHGNTSHYAVDMLNRSKIVITGRPIEGAGLQLHSLESQTLDVLMKLHIVRCPPGFVLNGSVDEVKVCDCAANSTPGLKCYPALFKTRLDYCYWVGYIGNGNTSDGFQSGPCPPGFCLPHPQILNGADHYNMTSLDQAVCGPQNRTGVLCGKCKSGYGVALYQPFRCVQCDSSTSHLTVGGYHIDVLLIWFFTEFLPFNVVFLLFILFNVNILSGWGGALYTFVFFCQVVTTSPVFLRNSTSIWGESPSAFSVFLSISKFMADFWSLNFFSYFVPPAHTCINESVSVQDLIIFGYFILLLWPLLIYILLSVIHRCYHRGYCCRPAHKCLFKMGTILAKCQQSEEGGVNSLAGLCSFLVLAFTKLVILTWEILVKAEVYSSNGELKDVFWYNGTVPWFDRDHHAPYAVPILLCSLVTLFIPTLLLVSFPLLPKLFVKLKLHGRRPFRWIISLLSTSYLMFFFDIFQGCFKPNARYFAALYLIYRLLFVMALAFTNNQETGVLQLSFCILFTLLHSFVQPFRSDKVNKMAALIFAALAFIIMGGDMSLYLGQCHRDTTSPLKTTVEVFTLFLLFIPHVVAAFFFILYCARLVRSKCYRGKEQGTHLAEDGYHSFEMEASRRCDEDWNAVKCIFDRGADEWDVEENNQTINGVQGEHEVLVGSSAREVHSGSRSSPPCKQTSGYGTL